MSVIQSTQPELRYLKRQNLENEAKIIGNYYRDLIRSYGVDCIYYKLDTSEYSNFKNIIDRNTILRQAYGYNDSPNYDMKAHVLGYMEVENDIFQLNKFGLNPNMDVNFFFESNDFACALATKLGQYKEYPIQETFIECEVPELNNRYTEFEKDIDQETKLPRKHYLSSEIYPYQLGLGYKENYYCENLSGKLFVEISGYELDKEYTIQCYPYEHTDFSITYPANSDLYKSLQHKIENDDYLETMIFLKYTVNKIATKPGIHILDKLNSAMLRSFFDRKQLVKEICYHLSLSEDYNHLKEDMLDGVYTDKELFEIVKLIAMSIDVEVTDNIEESIEKLYQKAASIKIEHMQYKYILSGKIYGNVLFFDTNELGKYVEKIHPSVGDLVEIDFPDGNSPERYEITECFDKQLTSDGISPLLHKYIWKCKARRYVDCNDDIDKNEADERLQEKLDHQQLVNEKVAEAISIYENNEDAVYGGYDLDEDRLKNYDKQDVRNVEHEKYEFVQEGQLIHIHTFTCGSGLYTDGYQLLFKNTQNDYIILAQYDKQSVVSGTLYESGLKWLKATKDKIHFVNIEGSSIQIACSRRATNVEELNLDNLYEASIDTSTHQDGSFVKFNGCRTYMFATCDQLFVKFESEDGVFQLV